MGIENHTCSREYPKQQEKSKRSSLKMCHPSQSSPNQNQAWQGVYPDLSAFNDLFSPAAPPPNPQSSPWISFPRSLGLQPIPQEQQQQQGSAQEQPSAPPATEQEPAGQTFVGSNVYSQQPQAGNQRSNTQSHSDAQGCDQGSNQSRRSTQSYNYSCTSPHIKHLFQAFTSRLLHFSSVATRASITFFSAIALFCFLSSLPGRPCHLLGGDLPAPHLRPRPSPALPP